jgi:hypothetical protein
MVASAASSAAEAAIHLAGRWPSPRAALTKITSHYVHQFGQVGPTLHALPVVLVYSPGMEVRLE